MNSVTLSKWILIVGGLLAALGSLAYVGLLHFFPDPQLVIENAARTAVKEAAFRLDPPPPVADDFIGSQACRECHQAIYDQYQGHPMSKSAAFIADAEPIENYADGPGFPVPGRLGVLLRAKRQEGKITHHEVREDGSGKLYDLEVPIDIEMGSGKRGRSYVINRDGFLYMSQLTWYTTNHSWGLSPGYNAHYNPRFSRRAVDGCVQCHVGRVVRNANDRDRLRPPYLAESAIGCERCHGPGGRHATYHRDKVSPSAPDPIINPTKLEPARREAVCNQCHVQGEDRILQYKRSEYDFRPGGLVKDVWVCLLKGTGLDSEGTKAVSQVEQMESSRCYRKSEGRFGCMSCHDAHTVPSPAESDRYYRTRCLTCHDSGKVECSLPESAERRQEVKDSCIACHMPRIPTNNVPHTAATDHRVMKVPTSGEASSRDADTIKVFQEGQYFWSNLEVNRAKGIYLSRLIERNGDNTLAPECRDLLLPIVAANPDDLESLHALGVAYWIQGELQAAERYWDQILAQDPQNERALANLGIICHDAGVFEGALAYLDKLIEVNPWRPEIYGRRAHILGRLGRSKEGVETAQKVLEMDPSIIQMHGWLAETYDLLGEKEKGQLHRTMMRRMTTQR